MSELEAILLGLIQGLTEFLPVSSSGHLVLLQSLFSYEEHNIAFDVAVHLATLLSVFTVYRKTIFELIKSPFQAVNQKKLNAGTQVIFLMFIASLPTGIIGIAFKDTFESLFNSLGWVGLFLMVTGTILLLTRLSKSDHDFTEGATLNQIVADISIKKAFLIGLAQSLAIAPGVSRSGSTIACGLFLNVSRNSAALFSFLISIPAILGASLIQFKDMDPANFQILPFIIGFVVSYVSGLVGLILILKMVKKGKLEVFTPYLYLVGASAIYFGFFT